MESVASREDIGRTPHLDEIDIEDLVEMLTSHFHGARHRSPARDCLPERRRCDA
jgi:hypothetical protein